MKRILILTLMTLVTVISCAFALSACDDKTNDTEPGGTGHTHVLEYVDAEEATCTKEGYAAYWYCADCGKYFTDAEGKKETTLSQLIIPAAAHTPADPVRENEVTATCTHEGSYDEVVYCRECNREISRIKQTIAATGHTFSEEWSYDDIWHWHAATCGHTEEMSDYSEHAWDEGVVSTQPTCTQDGEFTYTCLVCGKTRSETIAATGHTFSEEWSFDEICHWHAATCGHTEEMIDYSEHAWDDGVITKQFTCTIDGEIVYTCTVCGKTTAIILPATGHSFSGIWSFDETYHWHAATCEHTDEVRDKAEHTWDSGILTAPTCTQAGKITYTCKVCGRTKTETIAATGHTFSEEWSFDESYHWHAATCGHTEVRDKAEHTWDSGILTAPTCTQEGKITYTCTVCGKTRTEPVAATGHTFSEEWSFDETYHWHAATCGHTDEVRDKAVHTFENRVCTICHMVKVSVGLDLTLNPNGKSYSVSGIGTCTESDLLIPSEYEGLPIISVDSNAFKDCAFVTSVTIPDSVTTIGSSAFEGCSSLKRINIPEGVTTIGQKTFYDCTSLTEISLPDSVTMIDWYAFYNCSSLTDLSLSDNLTTIDRYAFYNCSSLTGISIPASVKSIGNSAFYNCSALTEVIIPEGVTQIADYTFNNCNALQSIAIPASVKSIGDMAFYNCNSLSGVYITDVSAWCAVKLTGLYSRPLYYAGKLYLNGKLVTNLMIPDGTASIGEYTFYGCTSLTSVTIPDSVTAINIEAFSECAFLTSVILFNGLTTIGNGAFQGCGSLTDISIPASVTSIGSSAFEGCASLASINIPDGVTSVNPMTFMGCSSLTSIVIPASVTSLSASAFDGCSQVIQTENGIHYVDQWAIGCESSLNFATIRSGTVGIAKHAFNGCASLVSMTIPDGVLYIDSWAFQNCTSLTDITIPESVKDIGWYTFRNCGALKSITIPDGVTYIGWETLYLCSALKSVTIPDGVTSIGNNAFRKCSSLTSITIPASVTSIGLFAFDNCTALTNITYSGTIAAWNAVEKDTNWNTNTGNYTIHCTDGDIVKS